MFNVAAVRRNFAHVGKSIYFNTASNGPLAKPAYRLQDDGYRLAKNAGVSGQVDVFEALKRIRKSGAAIFGCRVGEVGFGFNTTFGINLAAFGLPLGRGDEVILSDVEFPANVYPWLELRRRGIGVKFLKSTAGGFDIGRFEKAITRKTKVLSLSFVQFFNGYKNDLATLGDICSRRGIFFVVDAIQGAGAEPMNVRDWKVDIASAGAQKWLLSSQGTGLFYISEETKSRLIAPWRSWLGVDWGCDWMNLRNFAKPFESSAQQYEMGTYPGPLVMSLDWSLAYITRLGIKSIQQHNYRQLDTLIAYLRDEPCYRITSSLEKKHRSAILTFTTAKGDVRNLYQALSKRNIVTSVREGSIRVSVHLFNNTADINRLISVLKAFAR